MSSTVTSALDEQETVADDNGQQPVQDNQKPVTDQQQEERYLNNFVGEDKPYKTVEEAAEALAKKAVNADSFIETLKKEKHELEQRAVESKTIEDVLSALNSGEEDQPKPTAGDDNTNLKEQFRDFLQSYEKEKEEAKALEEKSVRMQQNQEKFWELGSSSELGFGSKEGVVAAIKQVIDEGKMTREEIDADGNVNPEKLLVTLKHFTGEKQKVDFSTDEKTQPTPLPDVEGMGVLTLDKINQFEKQNRERLKNDRAFKSNWVKYKHANYTK